MREDAVSPVIGEMLMLTLVLIMLPIATISLINQAPDDRIPSVTIRMEANETSLIFCHKGGDWIRWDGISVIIRDRIDEKTILSGDMIRDHESVTFDLGDLFICDRFGYPDGSRVDLVVPQAVLFSGNIVTGVPP